VYFNIVTNIPTKLNLKEGVVALACGSFHKLRRIYIHLYKSYIGLLNVERDLHGFM